MAADGDLASILERLPDATDQVEALQELKIVIASLPPAVLRDVLPNLSFNPVFDCLNVSDSEQVQLCCDVLDRMLAVLDPGAILTNFEAELGKGLLHPIIPVKKMCLNQIGRSVSCNVQQLTQRRDILYELIKLLGHDLLDVATGAGSILKQLGSSPDDLTVLFNAENFKLLSMVMNKSDVVKFRVYEVIVDISCTSPESLAVCAGSGVLQELLNETHKDDILVQLNSLELLTNMALCEHGLAYLDQQGVVRRLENMLGDAEGNAMTNFLMPGLIKFFGNVARVHPKEVCDKFPIFIRTVMDLLDDPNITLRGISIETVGFIGGTVEGKLAFDKIGLMQNVCHKLGTTIRDAPSDLRVRALGAVNNLIKLQVPDQTGETLALTERWFIDLGRSPLDSLISISRQPFLELSLATWGVLEALAALPWGQNLLNVSPGFIEYLLDRSTEGTKEGKDAKYTMVKTLVESPTALDVFGRVQYMKLKEYYREGAHYVRAQTEVAMEGAS